MLGKGVLEILPVGAGGLGMSGVGSMGAGVLVQLVN
jgi:hypothetical protein